MKKIISLAAVMLFAVILVSCGKKEPLVVKDSDTCIVLTVTDESAKSLKNKPLTEYMKKLRSDGKLEFSETDGMITSINGIDNAADYSSCWMLYTSDPDNSNSGWGTVEYNGKKYGSAVVGAEALKIKSGCLYIWVYQSF